MHLEGKKERNSLLFMFVEFIVCKSFGSQYVRAITQRLGHSAIEILSSCPSRIEIYDRRQGLGITAAGHQVGQMPEVHLAHCHY